MENNNFYLVFANLLDYPKDYSSSLFNEFKKLVGEKIKKEIPDLDTMEVEYTRLFINAHPFVPAPPYASLYLSSYDVYEEVENYYKKSNYAIEARAFPPDYLIYELIFLSNLFNDKNFKAEREFLKEHFLVWFNEFVKKVEENDNMGFYSFICRNINNFLKNRLKELENGKTDIPS